MNKYLGIDIGGTYIKYGTYTKEGNKISSDKIKTSSNDLEEFIDSLIKVIDINKDVSGIGVSMPGFVDSNTGFISDPGAISCLKDKNLKEIIFDRCGRRIEIENDSNCAALAEKWIGNGKNFSNLLTITIGTGIGGGIIINNKLFTGNKFIAGEFGYMIVQGEKNGNYKYSTASHIASTKALITLVAEEKNIEEKDIDGEWIFKKLEEKDAEVEKAYTKWIENISLVIYNLTFSFNPDGILLGGGISAQRRILEDVKNKIEEFDNRINNLVIIDKCKFDNDSGKIGAIYNYLIKTNTK